MPKPKKIRAKKNGEKTVILGAFVPVSMKELIGRLAEGRNHTVSLEVRKLLQESPRFKREMKRIQANA